MPALQLGPWILDERIARGGMAEVWRGRRNDHVWTSRSGSPGDDTPVCIKRLDPSLAADPDFVEMFRDEARLVLQLSHEHVVRTVAVYDDNPGGQPNELLLVMELVDGPSLARLKSALAHEHLQPPTLHETLTIASQLARALQHVHTVRDDDGSALSIVHRDVSPQNLLLDRTGRGRLVLIDFGVARAASRLTRTRAGTLKGKAAYMAPEQVRGLPLDGRTDQFAAAVVIWELLCRRPLFHGTNELRVLEQIERAEVVPPSVVLRHDVAADISADVDALVMKALSFDPTQRFSDMAAFGDAVDAVLARLGGPADLGPLVARGLAAIEVSGQKSEAPTRTRVLVTNPEQVADGPRDDDERGGKRAGGSFGALVAGATVVFGVVTGAVIVARGGGSSDVDAGPVVVVDVAAARINSVEAALTAVPAHPCRTELLDEIFDRSTLTPGLIDAIADDVTRCRNVAVAADTLRAELTTKKLLQAPPKTVRLKSKKRPRPLSPPEMTRRLDEMTRRAHLALDAAETDVARALLLDVVSTDPSRADAHRLLAEAYRRSGDVALSGVEVRAFLRGATEVDATERARLTRWLKRNGLDAAD